MHGFARVACWMTLRVAVAFLAMRVILLAYITASVIVSLLSSEE